MKLRIARKVAKRYRAYRGSTVIRTAMRLWRADHAPCGWAEVRIITAQDRRGLRVPSGYGGVMLDEVVTLTSADLARLGMIICDVGPEGDPKP